MRLIVISLLAAAMLAAVPVRAFDSSPPQPSSPHTIQQPDEAQLDRHGHYINKNGATVHAPAKSLTGGAPAGASAECRDGTYSFSQNHRGTCSHHGGVATWLN